MIAEVLALGVPAAADLAAVEKVLGEEDPHPGLLLALRGERAIAHRSVSALARSEVRLEDIPAVDEDVIVSRVAFSPSPLEDYRPPDVRAGRALREYPRIMELFAEAIEIARQPTHEQPALEPPLDLRIWVSEHRTPLIRYLMPPAHGHNPNFRHDLAHLRCVRLLLAAERYRHETGRWPDDPRQLVPRWLAAVPLTPHDGKPLRYERTKDGVTVSAEPEAQGSAGRPPIWGIRYHSSVHIWGPSYRSWDVDKRRQPVPNPE
jgi:hypothetical protein